MNKIFSALILTVSLGYAGDADKPNPAIEKALAPALADAFKSYAVYQDALAKATDKAVKELEKLKADAMKKNDLPLAVAVDAQIKSIKEGALGERVAAKSGTAGDLLGESKDPKSLIVGKWKRDDLDVYYLLGSDNTVTMDGQNIQLIGMTGVTGVWSMKLRNGKIEGATITIKWSRKDLPDTVGTFVEGNVFTMGARKAVKTP